jgi:NADH-quinone oxidoreductase subunit L
MTIPLVILAIFALGAGALNLPNSHWLSHFLGQPTHAFNPTAALLGTTMAVMGIALGFVFYRRAFTAGEQLDPLEQRMPGIFRALHARLYVDELYAASIGRLTTVLIAISAWVDRQLGWGLSGINRITGVLGRLNAGLDEQILNGGADQLARGTTASGNRIRRLESGKAQDYLALIFGGVLVLGAVALYLLHG